MRETPNPSQPVVHIYARPYYNQRGRLVGKDGCGRPIVRLFATSETVTLPSPTDYELVKP